jgi:hypothetical protein
MSAQLGTCSTCEQWRPLTPVSGECRNRSPVALDQYRVKVWPETAASDWCGDHMTKIEAV